ncbi:MAG: S-methyl-5-thioribose-1-phosphate isomerase [Adlercreutzia caecimuris]|nr:S-methyl-5-thioribose-1-phosphate isomerase [Adlercreutzia caecimuris]
MIDQRALPSELVEIRTSDWRQVVDAVKTLAVRGAPAIGVAGAAAVMLAAYELAERGAPAASTAAALFAVRLREAARVIAEARPTAVNLSWGVNRAIQVAAGALKAGKTPRQTAEALRELTGDLIVEDEAINRAIGAHGAALLAPIAAAKERPLTILTHCNAGSLATAFYGTALGVVYAAAEQGLVERVYADETRPVGQGARLTVWELSRAGVPATLICDNMAASLMAAGRIDAVVVGADRIAANGDAANKIGTLGVAVLAHHFGVPFYVAAPESTRDNACATGADIPIEERDAAEVLANPIEGVEVFNPAFDVTPAALITAIITEKGVWHPGS